MTLKFVTKIFDRADQALGPWNADASQQNVKMIVLAGKCGSLMLQTRQELWVQCDAVGNVGRTDGYMNIFRHASTRVYESGRDETGGNKELTRYAAPF